jgi:hypothetical protein
MVVAGPAVRGEPDGHGQHNEYKWEGTNIIGVHGCSFIIQVFVRWKRVSARTCLQSASLQLTYPEKPLVNRVANQVEVLEEPVNDAVGERLRRQLLDELLDLGVLITTNTNTNTAIN